MGKGYARGSADGPLKIFGRLNINRLEKMQKAQSDRDVAADASAALNDFIMDIPYEAPIVDGHPLNYKNRGTEGYRQHFSIGDINNASSASEREFAQGQLFHAMERDEGRVIDFDNVKSHISTYRTPAGDPRLRTRMTQQSMTTPGSVPPLGGGVIDSGLATHDGRDGSKLTNQGAELLRWKLNSFMPKDSQISRINVHQNGSGAHSLDVEVESHIPQGTNYDNYGHVSSKNGWRNTMRAWGAIQERSPQEGAILSPADKEIYDYSKGGTLSFEKAQAKHKKSLKNTVLNTLRWRSDIPVTLSGKPNIDKMLRKSGLYRSNRHVLVDKDGYAKHLQANSQDAGTLQSLMGRKITDSDPELIASISHARAKADKQYAKDIKSGMSEQNAQNKRNGALRMSYRDIYSSLTKNQHSSFAEHDDNAEKAALVLSRMNITSTPVQA